MNRVLQPRPLIVLGFNVWMGTAAGADELVEVPYRPKEALDLNDLKGGGVVYATLMLWCFVLNPHRRSPYSKFAFDITR